MSDIRLSVDTQISRISDAANTIKSKSVELGLVKDDSVDTAGVVSNNDTLDIHARAIAKISTKGADTISPGTEDKVIKSGQYLTGAQTIKAVSLDCDGNNVLNGITVNMKSGDTVIDTSTGSLDVNYYMTGSTAPDSTVGDVGDYFVVI